MTDLAKNASASKQTDVAAETAPESDSQPKADNASETTVDKRVDERLLLATYVDRSTPPSFTEEAKSQILYEMSEYAEELTSLAGIQRRADGNAEKVLRRHVADSAGSLRRKSDGPADRAADWCKWIGFTWLGLTVSQYIHIKSEQHISTGSVNWFVIDLVITAVLLSVAAVLNRPWGYFTDRFHRE
jgi:hypothetical protein